MPEDVLGGTAIKPEGWDRTGLEAFKWFLYNPKTGAILSRTPLSWFKIIVFYIIYYSLLALFWIACLQIFFLTLPEHEPKWLLDESLVGSNPGVGLRPRMSDARIDSSLYMLSAGSEDSQPTNIEGEGEKNVDFAVRYQDFLKIYENKTYKADMEDCTNSPNTPRTSSQRSCVFDTMSLEECANFPYGYLVNLETHNVVEPCFLLKLNKLRNWVPTPVNETDLDKPEYAKMSESLKNRIQRSIDKDYVWIDCEGRYPADREAVEIEYFPSNQGMPLKYFPFKGGNYHQPLVAIKVRLADRGDDSHKFIGQLIHLQCRAWYDGVVHSTKHKEGLVQFDLMLEPKN